MNIADWAILVVIVASTMHAAATGFFQEAFHLAGLVAGYLVAAWQYQRLAAWFETFLKSQWAAETAGFLIIFFAVAVAGRYRRPDRTLGDEDVRSQVRGSVFGRSSGVASRLSHRGGDYGDYDRVHSIVEVAGGVPIGPILPGGGAGCHLGRPCGVARTVLSGTGFAAPFATASPERRPAAPGSREVGLRKVFIGNRQLFTQAIIRAEREMP